MRLVDLKIDDDFKNLLPPLDAETYTALEKDIVSNGVLDPVITWNGFIADGHNRYSICKAHRIEEVQTKSLNKATKSDVMQWIVDHQFAKRNLTKSEQIRLLAKVEEQIAKEAKERQGTRNDLKNFPSNLTESKPEGETAEIMAKKLGVSKNTYKDMKTVVEKGTPEQVKRMDKGGKGNGVSTIAREIKDGVGEGERKCIKCGRILPIEQFRNKKSPYACVQCETERRKREKERANGLEEIGKVAELLKRSEAIGEHETLSAKEEVTFLVDNFKSAMERLRTSGKEFDADTFQIIDGFIRYLEKVKGE